MTRKTWEDKRTKELRHEIPEGFEPPIINGYTLTYHAALRMIARQIELDWVADALTKPGRSRSDGTRSFYGDMAMCVVDHRDRTIVTVSYGVLNGGTQ